MDYKFWLKKCSEILVVLSYFLVASANCTEQYSKSWTAATIIGSFPGNSKFKYYLEPQIRFIDNPYVFNEFFFLGGLGYEINPDLMVFAGPSWFVNKNSEGKVFQENRYWQQLNWRAVQTDAWSGNSRTRLEERRNLEAPQLAYRLRERFWARIPFKNWKSHSLSLYDEVFFNLNHPTWVSPRFFEQNRAFIGISTQFSKSFIMDVGYLNQYILSNTNQLNNVFVVSLSATY